MIFLTLRGNVSLQKCKFHLVCYHMYRTPLAGGGGGGGGLRSHYRNQGSKNETCRLLSTRLASFLVMELEFQSQTEKCEKR